MKVFPLTVSETSDLREKLKEHNDLVARLQSIGQEIDGFLILLANKYFPNYGSEKPIGHDDDCNYLVLETEK